MGSTALRRLQPCKPKVERSSNCSNYTTPPAPSDETYDGLSLHLEEKDKCLCRSSDATRINWAVQTHPPVGTAVLPWQNQRSNPVPGFAD